ncbi:hypothetical protein RB653_002666 [Dictyostelium firmibasis]|uniref:Uncharacterized protein n=1 Tax=Dictyostelium firmibasis TaxID=79012 RepID=A0AAN7TXP6_9MYCE
MTILKTISNIGFSNTKNSFVLFSNNTKDANQDINIVSKSKYSKIVKGATMMGEGIAGLF